MDILIGGHDHVDESAPISEHDWRNGFSAVCSPTALSEQSPAQHAWPGASATLKAMQNLKQQKKRMLGYPINMVTPAEEFFAWRNELAAVGFNQFAFNNVGNPYDHSHIPFNCHPLRRN